ncbi:Protein of unknown function [Pyronema omphalodes CBS 100304]|uniref:Uncharacterized protein n=1 Tax=Pyronema omphalodes (strain CBS 100304) TaxID=1076935 RepID=U4LBH5_PYROM|nr:Protein of unknown function [Pyronema omphalodes CBS 100304]
MQTTCVGNMRLVTRCTYMERCPWGSAIDERRDLCAVDSTPIRKLYLRLTQLCSRDQRMKPKIRQVTIPKA